jgi:hypothetical protein
MPAVYSYSVRIEQGASLSAAVVIDGLVPVRIQTPAAIDGTVMTFEASSDGQNFAQLWDPVGPGAEYQIAIGASKSISLRASDFMGVRAIKLRTGTSGSPTAQSAARVLTLVCAQLTP